MRWTSGARWSSSKHLVGSGSLSSRSSSWRQAARPDGCGHRAASRRRRRAGSSDTELHRNSGLGDGAGWVDYTYDELNRLTEVTRDTDSISYAYDDASNLTSRTYPSNVTTAYTYDDANRLTTVAADARTTSYGYDEAGNLVEIEYPSSTGYVAAMTYDETGRLTEIVNEKPGQQVLSQFTYTLDPVGNPTEVATTNETITYSYDELNRLIEACYVAGCTGSGLAGITYTYDDVGNRLTQVRHSATDTTINYTYNADDQMTQAGNKSYTYDDNGNQITRGPDEFTYDLENRMIEFVSGSKTHTFAYDGDGNRILDSAGTAPNEITKYLWDINWPLPEIAIERRGDDALLRRYTYGLGRIAMSPNASNTYYYLTDSLGSTANLIRHNGDVKWTYTYEPFGGERSATSGQGAPQNPIRFTGQRFEDGILYSLRARVYDPASGRLLQPDPVDQSIRLPQVSTYVYAANRPSVLVDPSGKSPVDSHIYCNEGLWDWLSPGCFFEDADRAADDLFGDDGVIVDILQCFAAAAEAAKWTESLGLDPIAVAAAAIVGCYVGLNTPPVPPTHQTP